MKILFADDHGLVREGIKPFLEELADDVVIEEAADFQGALNVASSNDDLDLIILDLNMPGMNGLEGIKNILGKVGDAPVVILSGQDRRDDILAALDAGAAGFIPKTTGGRSLINALRLVLSGEKYLPANILSRDSGSGSFIANNQPEKDADSGRNSEGPLSSLSPREAEVLSHLIDGKTNKEIARELDLQEITVKVHVRNIYKKIGASNRAQAVRIAIEDSYAN